MATGVVKWFDPEKGFGFVRPDDGSEDVFVKLSAVDGGASCGLAESDRVEFEIEVQPYGREVSRLSLVV
jgi:cold shock protein